MSFNGPCNSSWTKEEDKIFENTIAIYFNDDNLLKKMEEALPGKSSADILEHYNILIEDVTAIESGCVPLPGEQQGDSSQNSNADGGWRRGALWSEEEHRLFLEGLAKYGRGDWRSISRYCVITRTPTQVASHAQKYFKRLKADPKEKKRRRSILDITSADAEVGGTSQATPRTNNESLLPFTIASSGTSSHPITRIGSELEALVTEHKDEDNDINSIFDVGKAPTSHAMLYNAAHDGGSSSSTVASFGANNAPENNVAAPSGMPSCAVASFGSTNARESMVAAPADQAPPFAPSSN